LNIERQQYRYEIKKILIQGVGQLIVFRQNIQELSAGHENRSQIINNCSHLFCSYENTGYLMKYIDPVLGLDQNLFSPWTGS
jgi:hypothetical protein